jgi:hypothetical protein
VREAWILPGWANTQGSPRNEEDCGENFEQKQPVGVGGPSALSPQSWGYLRPVYPGRCVSLSCKRPQGPQMDFTGPVFPTFLAARALHVN